jgi:YidC/Oxa1 family membrane protein insertase
VAGVYPLDYLLVNTYMEYFVHQFSLFLLFLNSFLGNFGGAIILFTLIVRLILLPITLPSIRAQKKMVDLKPEIDKLKSKFKGDKAAFQQAQLELYKKYNINPLAGCLPQLGQFFVLIVLYQTLLHLLKTPMAEGVVLNLHFWWLDLSKPDQFYIMPVLAALTQLVLSLMLVPATEVKDTVPNNSKKLKVQEANKKEEDTAEMAATMQQQMLFMMPIMTGVFALNFPAGLSLYWVVTTIFSVVQQYIISGPGGLVTYYTRVKLWFHARQRNKRT